MEVVLTLVEKTVVEAASPPRVRARAVVLVSAIAGAHGGHVGAPAPAHLGELLERSGVESVQRAREIRVETRQVELVDVLAVSLRSADRVGLEPVVGAQLERRGKVVGPGVGPRGVASREARVHAVPGLAHDGTRGGEPAHGTRVHHHRLLQQVAAEPPAAVLVQAAESELLLVHEARALGRGIGDDVDRATDRRRGQVDRRKAALELDAGCGIAQAVPVGPVDPPVLHVVDGHTVDHHGGVALVEAAHVDARVAGAAPLLGRVDAGGNVQHQRKIPGAQLVLDLRLAHVGERHRGLPVLCSSGEDLEGIQGDRLPAQAEVQRQRLAVLQRDLGLGLASVSDQDHRDGVRPTGTNAFHPISAIVPRQRSRLDPGQLVRDHDLRTGDVGAQVIGHPTRNGRSLLCDQIGGGEDEERGPERIQTNPA